MALNTEEFWRVRTLDPNKFACYLVHSLEDFEEAVLTVPTSPGAPSLGWPVRVDPRVGPGRIWVLRADVNFGRSEDEMGYVDLPLTPAKKA